MGVLLIDVAGREVFWPALTLVGLVVGVVAGMFGIGGGFLLTPALAIGFGIPMPIAVGTSLCQQIGTSVGSFLKHRQYRGGEPWMDAYMLGGSLVGVHLGARLLQYLATAGTVLVLGRRVALARVVLQVLYLLLLVATLVPVLRSLRGAGAAHAARAVTPGPLASVTLPPRVLLPSLGLRVSMPVLVYVGLVTGAASGLLGIGGGVLLLPVLLHGYGLSLRDAAGTGILLLLATVLAATAVQAWHGLVDLRLAAALLAGSTVGSQLGARATHRLPARALKVGFVALVSATIVAIAADLGARWLSR